MKTRYDDLDLTFELEGFTFHVLNLVFERFEHPIPEHSHGEGCYEIHYIPYGKGYASIGGKRYPLEGGSLYTTGPHILHEQFPDSEDPMSEYCIYFQIERDGESVTSKKLRNKDTATAIFMSTTLWYGKDSQDLLTLMHRIFEELDSRKIGCRIQVTSLLRECIIAMVRNYQSGLRTPIPMQNRIDIRNSRSIILEESFLYEYNTLTLDILAKRLCLSPRQTERLIKENFSKSFLEKRTEARMSAATALLRTSDISITALSEKLGYSSSEHFSSAFRDYWDMSPRTFRTKYKTAK